MRALYCARSTHDVSLYASMGMPPDEIKRRVEEDSGDFPVWPEHWCALSVFRAMVTQWRVDFGRRTGLDYAALPTVMRLNGIKPIQQSEVFDSVRMMEREALTLFSERIANG